ncbi:MAG: hypothetical protein P1P86_06285 [Bacteroidales bacterium]|nr:hypothetical protein [Bacteroidales bacterium]
MKILLVSFASIAILFSCNTSGSKQAPDEKEAEINWSLKEVWSTDTLLATCESVLYDKSRNLLFVSCINGAPAEKNGEGYISSLRPDGRIETLKWVTGLNAPKGMGVSGNLLYVADIDQLVIIDIENSEIIERLDIEGASFLNDVAVGTSGRVYFTDSDTGFIWIYSDGKLGAWITDSLERPNGLFVEESRILLTCSGSEDLKVINKATGAVETVTGEIGHGDGIEFTGTEGYYIATSWSGEIFMIGPDFKRTSLLKTSDKEINSADIGFNLEEQVLYVPTFFDNRVVAYKLER